MKEKIIGRGAEALLIKKGSIIIKRRIKKGYRHPKLDTWLRKSRTRHESKLLQKASAVVSVPKIKKSAETEIEMQYIKGKLLSEWLDKLPKAKALAVCKKIGQGVSLLHDQDVIHGDLTTSNMILSQGKVYFIDFGLGFHSGRVEDKAVDLHLLKQALESRHFSRFKAYFSRILQGYKKSKKAKEVLERLIKVERRGRYKGKIT